MSAQSPDVGAARPLRDANLFVLPLLAIEATDPERVGPKAATLATMGRAALPIPGGFCLTAAAYDRQITALGFRETIERYDGADEREARRLSVAIRLALYENPIAPEIVEPLLASWRSARDAEKSLWVVRSSALIEDRAGANFAGQFESFLGLDEEVDFLTAIRACWAALWSTNARRYMSNHGHSPARTAMAVLIQPLVPAIASGGGLSQTAEGQMVLSATWGLGSAIAQGEVVPDRIVLSRQGFVRKIHPGRKDHRQTCGHGLAAPQPVSKDMAIAPCLTPGQAVTLGRLLRRAETLFGTPIEIEWALDDSGFKLLQARPSQVQPLTVPDDIWLKHPKMSGHPAGIGWGTGRAVVVNCECELSRVAPGDVLVTRVAGPALSQVLTQVAGIVTELGGSTSHLASLARERGIPMVLGVLDATRAIPDGAQVAVDGVAGIVRWIK